MNSTRSRLQIANKRHIHTRQRDQNAREVENPHFLRRFRSSQHDHTREVPRTFRSRNDHTCFFHRKPTSASLYVSDMKSVISVEYFYLVLD